MMMCRLFTSLNTTSPTPLPDPQSSMAPCGGNWLGMCDEDNEKNTASPGRAMCMRRNGSLVWAGVDDGERVATIEREGEEGARRPTTFSNGERCTGPNKQLARGQ